MGGEVPRGITSVVGHKAGRLVIRHAGQDQPPLSADKNPVLRGQYIKAQAPHLCTPVLGSVVVLVVSGDEKDTLGAPQSAQRRHQPPKLLHRSIREVAGDSHQVRVQPVHPLHHLFQSVGPNGETHVQVAHLDDSKPLQV